VSDPALDSVVSVYFALEIDSADLGVFSSCEGLGIELQITQREDGGGGSVVHLLPGRFKYTNVRVTRPIGPDTAKTMAWLQRMVNGVSPSNARLSALSPDGNVVYSWSLLGVLPARWTGPSFNASSLSPATETLELAYSSILFE
jgi:phage tail-like protein